MNVELPNDWGAIRRLHHQINPCAAAKQGDEEELVQPSESTKNAAAESRKRKEIPAPHEDDQAAVKWNQPRAHRDAEGDQARNRVTKGPLGPRGIFNAVTHDSPEKGQLKQIVLMHLGKTTGGSLPPPCDKEDTDDLQMEVHCLLSKLPYQKMLSDLFSHNDRELLSNPNIPYVTRGYEENFMREPLNSTERLCAKGEQCECMFIDAEQPFTGIEFLLPGEKQPPTPHLCVVCCRAVTQQLYYDIMFDKHDFGGVIQRFGNIHSQPGEYALDAMLIAAPNVALHIMPLPIVSHQRNRYSVFMKRGIKHLKQSRVHFQSTPSC
jgi:hypothetical protein